MRSRASALVLAVALASGCVSMETFDAKVAELEALRAEQAKMLVENSQKLLVRVDEAERSLADAQAQVTQLTAERDRLQKQVDDTAALAGELRARLEQLGQNVEKLTGEKGQLTAGLDDAKHRLEELRKQKISAEARAATFRHLMIKLRTMIDAGQLKVAIRDGRMLITLPNDVLFDSGKTDLKPAGKAALAKVAQVLAGLKDRKFLVAGHTDDVKIRTSHFASNWELSMARALEVTMLLIADGMEPHLLAPAGFAEFSPVARNDSESHRAQNRRIEIVLQPNLSDLPPLDELLKTP